MDLCTWIVVFQYYSIIKQMSKLREEAIIQCPAPIVTPYPYFRENIYESQNGLRHQVCDNDQYSCVAWILDRSGGEYLSENWLNMRHGNAV